MKNEKNVVTRDEFSKFSKNPAFWVKETEFFIFNNLIVKFSRIFDGVYGLTHSNTKTIKFTFF